MKERQGVHKKCSSARLSVTSLIVLFQTHLDSSAYGFQLALQLPNVCAGKRKGGEMALVITFLFFRGSIM